ncbi:MAG: (1-_4)-alpha-D-glucan 1-alpha-D-glucosylmutase [Thermoleophilaceae bacterium]|nr:(1->4)-alpha-D-glucan 1-alpha-D-glucosylmutase [Thermoleophilaceae bacterium]
MTAFRATYRLQLAGSFGFAAARELVPYLASLGVSHLYLPPSFEARPGSTHGYDVVDPGRISSALGGEEEFRALVASAREAGLGVVLDIVPNHMAVDGANRYWADPSLREKFFDIDPVTGRHRRFFDIDHLAGVRQEDPEVFEETHRLALALVRDGLVDGLRVDHPDGLADPAGYLERLRAEGVEHVWVEKILDPGEKLRDWPVDGTVGYEFLNDACALFVDPAGEAALDALWHEVAGGDARPFGAWAQEAKLEQAAGPFAQDLQRLGRPDLPLAEAASSLPVYRTYVVDSVDEADRAAVREVDPAVARMLLLEDGAPPGFVTRFQQTTPAVMAKGVEDTAFYRYGRLLALNDVGGDPSRFGITVAEFHAANAERAERFPNALLTTQTHDAKRSADVRARIAAVSGMADDWALHVHRWFELNEPLRTAAGAPDRIEEYLLYQTLVGAWPIELERIEAYVEKALREAKRNSSWAKPDERWESGVKAFCRALYDHEPFLADFEPLVERVAAAGERAALAQLVLKLTSPGVPDIYNGDELPYFALVDPDNRRPVDWDRRRELLRRVKAGDASERKLWLIERLLALRARRPEAFAGSYEALDAGPATCAFVRGGEVLVAVPLLGPADASALTLPAGDWADAASIDVFGFTILERPGR